MLEFSSDHKTIFVTVPYGMPIHAASIKLVESIKALKSYPYESFSPGSIIRLEFKSICDSEIGTTPTQALLSNMCINTNILPHLSRVYYMSRQSQFGLLGYGTCKLIQDLDEVRSILSVSSNEIHLVGGDLYDKNSTSIPHGSQKDNMSSKQRSDADSQISGWIIPLIEVRHMSSLGWPHVILAVNICIPSNITLFHNTLDYIASLIPQFQWSFRHTRSYLSLLSPLKGDMIHTGMNKEQYIHAVNEAIHHMQQQELDKVVYALRLTGTTWTAINPFALLLAVSNHSYMDESKRYCFLFAPYGYHQKVFISLSPERLCHVNDSTLRTEALAGTYPTKDFNDTLANDLKTSNEHSAVTKYIVNILSTLGGEVRIENRELLKMKEVIHFKQELSVVSSSGTTTTTNNTNATITGDIALSSSSDSESVVHESIHGLALLKWATENLHPTPAVCGFPLHKAQSMISTYERFPRELYASYCGIITHTGGELFVGLRSAMIEQNKIHIYAGAGIIQGSDPTAEFNEITLKMAQYTSCLRSITRPVMTQEYPNATTAQCAMMIEELIRQGVQAFCVCPGSRSTPVAIAIYRNSVSRAMTQVVHDERVAGFYALGCARAGILCAVLVTSGTAVSNLLPALSEARESNLAMILLTADRPYESRDIGEAQTIKQTGLFNHTIGWERDFIPFSSDDITLSTYLLRSFLSDISYGVSEIALRRHQTVQFNLQFRKPLEPIQYSHDFDSKFIFQFHPKIQKWVQSTQPYTIHTSPYSFFQSSNSIFQKLIRWIQLESQFYSILFVVGEITSIQDAHMIRYFCQTYRIPCICDTLSMLTENQDNEDDNCIFLGADRLFNSTLLTQTLSASMRMVFRIGGSIISARVTEFVHNLPACTMIRIRDDSHSFCRHDSAWLADHYIHGNINEFLSILNERLSKYHTQPVYICDTLKLLRLTSTTLKHNIHSSLSSSSLLPSSSSSSNSSTSNNANWDEFTEPMICRMLQELLPQSTPYFISSSMACRDFDAYGSILINGTSYYTRRVGCNRGANGIDGVISTAVGYAYCCASSTDPVVLLIGDVATLHDLSAISLASGNSPGHNGFPSILPGGGRVGKIIVLNNSGGAIFSFLPAVQYRHDFFSPYLDTPHNLNISQIAQGLCHPTQRCVRVTNQEEFSMALKSSEVFLIECYQLPNHEDNVTLHKQYSTQLVQQIDSTLIKLQRQSIQWTLHRTSQQDINPHYHLLRGSASLAHVSSLPLIVLLHGWLGDPSDWDHLLPSFLRHGFPVLTVSSHTNIYSPTLFCHTLHQIFHQDIHSTHLLYTTQYIFHSSHTMTTTNTTTTDTIHTLLPNTNQLFPGVILIGYSQGGRLAMHYQTLYPQDVKHCIILSTAPEKNMIAFHGLEDKVIYTWTNKCTMRPTAQYHHMSDNSTTCIQRSSTERDADQLYIEKFLNWWYKVPVFANIQERLPSHYSRMIRKRIDQDLSISSAIQNMINLAYTTHNIGTTKCSIDLALCGSLDTKYVNLISKCLHTSIKSVHILPNTGHALLIEANIDDIMSPILQLLQSSYSLSPHNLHPILSTNYYTNNIDMIDPSSADNGTITAAAAGGGDAVDTAISDKRYICISLSDIKVEPFTIPMKKPLVVLSNNMKTSYPTRRGYRICMTLTPKLSHLYEGDNNTANADTTWMSSRPISIQSYGEIYEPVFSHGNLQHITYDSLAMDIQEVIQKLKDIHIEVSYTSSTTTAIVSSDIITTLTPVKNTDQSMDHSNNPIYQHITAQTIAESIYSLSYTTTTNNNNNNSVIQSGVDQCLLYGLSSIFNISFVDILHAFMFSSSSINDKQTKNDFNRNTSPISTADSNTTNPNIEHSRTDIPLSYSISSHIYLNRFATMRDTSSHLLPDAVTNNINHVSIKVKVGDTEGLSMISDAERVNHLVQLSLSSTSHHSSRISWLRLDSNQSWNIEQACIFALHLSEDAINAIEYIEEPLQAAYATSAGYQELLQSSSNWRRIKIGLDETLCTTIENILSIVNIITLNSEQAAVQYVIKPSLTSLRFIRLLYNSLQSDNHTVGTNSTTDGNMSFNIALKQKISKERISNESLYDNITISCTFENGMTLAYLICIVAALYPHRYPMSNTSNDSIIINTTTPPSTDNTTTNNNNNTTSSSSTGTIDNSILTTPTIYSKRRSASHGVHPLIDMIAFDPSTAEYTTLITHDTITLSDCYHLLHKYMKSTFM